MVLPLLGTTTNFPLNDGGIAFTAAAVPAANSSNSAKHSPPVATTHTPKAAVPPATTAALAAPAAHLQPLHLTVANPRSLLVRQALYPNVRFEFEAFLAFPPAPLYQVTFKEVAESL